MAGVANPPAEPPVPKDEEEYDSDDSDEPSSRKGSYGPAKKSREKNKQKHNESESRRRSRLREKFFELRAAAGQTKKDRFNILESSIEKLRAQEARIQQLEQAAQAKPQVIVKEVPSLQQAPASVDIASPLLANIPTATVALDGRFRDCNAAFCQLLSTDRASLLATSMFSFQHPSELLNTFTMVKKLLTGEMTAWETDRKCVDGRGESIDVHLTLATVQEKGKPAYYVMLLLRKQSPADFSAVGLGAASVPVPVPAAPAGLVTSPASLSAGPAPSDLALAQSQAQALAQAHAHAQVQGQSQAHAQAQAQAQAQARAQLPGLMYAQHPQQLQQYAAPGLMMNMAQSAHLPMPGSGLALPEAQPQLQSQAHAQSLPRAPSLPFLSGSAADTDPSAYPAANPNTAMPSAAGSGAGPGTNSSLNFSFPLSPSDLGTGLAPPDVLDFLF